MHRTLVMLLLLWRLSAASVSSAVEPVAAKKPEPTLRLGDYTLQSGPINIPGIRSNASGLTYRPDTESLFVIVDYPESILELDLRAKLKRKIVLDGFHDVEGIAWLREDRFAIVEEGRCVLSLLQLTPETTVIRPADVKQKVIQRRGGGNKGLEGLCYDAGNMQFFVVKEKRPRKIYRWAYPTEGPVPVEHPWDIEKNSLGLSDLSGIAFDRGTGHLLILSHESQQVVECTVDGRKVGTVLDLKKVPKAEGIALDRKGTLYICSEPDLLYIYTRKPRSPR